MPSTLFSLCAATVVACALGQQMPQIRSSNAGDLTATATDFKLSQPNGGQTISLSTVAASLAGVSMSAQEAALNVSILQANVSTLQDGQVQLQSRSDLTDLALVNATTARNSLNTSIQNVMASLSTLTGQLSTASAELSALALLANPPSCPISSLYTSLSGVTATPSATMGASGSSVPSGGSVVFNAAPGYYLTGGPVTVTCSSSSTTAGGTGTWSSSSAPTGTPCISGCASCNGPNQCNVCSPGGTVTATVPASTVNINSAGVTFDPVGLSILGRRGSAITSQYMQIAQRQITDGNPQSDRNNYPRGPNYLPRTCNNPAWIQVDLGTNMKVGNVSVWHYWLDARQYCGQRIAISTTGQFAGEETEIHSAYLTPHMESSAGLTVPANGTIGRYVRHWAAGSDRNAYVHFIEIAIAAAPTSATTTISCV